MAQGLRILMLAHYYPPEMGAAAARLHGFARWLVRFGHQVTVLTGIPNYPDGVIPPEYRGKLLVREELDGVDVIRSWVYATSHKGATRRLLNYLSFVGSSLISGLFHIRRTDVTIASSPPLFIGLPGWLLARRFRAPWVLDIRDVWPEVAVEVGTFAPDSLFVRWMARLARFLYRRADCVVHVTENQRSKLVDGGVPEANLRFVANGVDMDIVANAPEIDWREQLGLGDRFVVVYAGLIGVVHGVEILTEAASLLRDDARIHFLVVGDGVQKPAIVQSAGQLGLTNITFLDWQVREMIPSILRAGDIAWVSISSNRQLDVRPVKMLEAWACGKPVILTGGGEAASLVEMSEGGLVIPPGQPSRLAEAIELLQAQPDKLEAYGRNGYQFVKDRFARQNMAHQMEQILLSVKKNGSPSPEADEAMSSS